MIDDGAGCNLISIDLGHWLVPAGRRHPRLGRCALTGKNQGRQRRLVSILLFFFRTGEEKMRTAQTRIGINT
jgi:hypothetical protein